MNKASEDYVKSMGKFDVCGMGPDTLLVKKVQMLEDMLDRLVEWYQGRSQGFRDRAKPTLWYKAAAVSMTSCNWCALKRLVRRAKREGKDVTILTGIVQGKEYGFEEKEGYEVHIHTRGEEPSPDNWAAQFIGLLPKCCTCEEGWYDRR